MADWDEIKRLAADFQRTQTSDTLQRLSERNVIDIVKKLTELQLIELIYTCDGKEFITPEHLTREIEDEVYVNGGRMHLHDLSSKLNVDYQHVESRAQGLVKEKSDEYSMILGQVIHTSYKDNLGKQINEYMLMNGQLSISEFAKTIDLPSEILLTIVKEILPRFLDEYVVSQDERTYYTTDMMDRYKSIIVGTLSAITKPTTIASIMKRLDISENIFIPTAESLIKEGRIDASIENRLFIPSIYAREQNEWINKFYASNSYIEYDVLSRMDIKQPKTFLKKRFPDGIPLKTCFIHSDLLSQVESLIEESITSDGFIDISTIIPSAIETDDIEQMLQEIFKRNKQFKCLIFERTYVCSHGYVEACRQKFQKLMPAKAQDHLKQGKLISHFLGGKMPEKVKQAPTNPEEKAEKTDVDESKLSETKNDGTIVDASKVDECGANESSDQPSMEKSVSQIIEEENQSKQNRKERRDKKSKAEVAEVEDSDDEFAGKKSKGKKSGGGLVGREVRRKAVKKKYLPGNKSNQKNVELSEDESAPSKSSKSNKGRASRRGTSPKETPKSQLIFMSREELKANLRGEGSDEFYQSIAESIEEDLNKAYEVLARLTLDDYIKAQAENEENPSEADVIDLVE